MTQPINKITKAIIPVAGYGTRRLPVAKAIEKCMVPVCNRPIIDYAVEECVRAGITDIFFVVSPDFEQLRAYYSNNIPLEAYLTKRGKTDLLHEVQAIPTKANFHYLIQDTSGAYGTAVPVWVARDAVHDDSHFVVVFGDDFIFHDNPKSEGDLARMASAVAEHRTNGALLGITMNDSDVMRYGAIKEKIGIDGVSLLESITEKPQPGAAPSNLASISYYIFDNGIMPFIEDVLKEPNSLGEHFLTDAVNAYVAADNRMVVVNSAGIHLDGGYLKGWVEANRIVYESQYGS